MEALWQYQLRIQLSEGFATLVRREPSNPALKPLNDVLAKFNATLTCQLDAFVDYVAEAEANGVEHYPLYQWTKATIADPAKQTKHLQVYTVHMSRDEVYPKEVADAMEADLSLLVDGVSIKRIARYDTNPENNPQPPTQ
jgi:hypothetical protein